MKLFYDYFPIICFFVSYKVYGIYIATAVTMLSSLVQLGILCLCKRFFEKLHLITMALVLVFGAATLLFHKPIFIKWKPSVIYWLFAFSLLISEHVNKKSFIRHLLDSRFNLPQQVWKRLNFFWVIFFFLLGCLNIYICYQYSTNAWVDFKLFGSTGLLIIFSIAQAIYLSRHIRPEKSSS